MHCLSRQSDDESDRTCPLVNSESYAPDFEHPGVFPWHEAKRIRHEESAGIWYVNPVSRVHAPEDSDEFIRVVMKRQAEWFRLLSRQFGNGWRRVRNQEKDQWQRSSEFDGIIVVNQVAIPFGPWRTLRRENQAVATPSAETLRSL